MFDLATLKALHIIFVVCWFAGLFYIVRLFIYHTEALDKNEAEKAILSKQLAIMQKKLWYAITVPSMLATIFFGTILAIKTQSWREEWFIVKAIFIVFLLCYHHICIPIRKSLLKNQALLSSLQLRIFNEVATLFLVFIVFLAVTKSIATSLWASLAFTLFAVIVFMLIKILKKSIKRS